jgi:hypothetical protein
MLTQRIREGKMNQAIGKIQQLDSINGEVTRIRVESLAAD